MCPGPIPRVPRRRRAGGSQPRRGVTIEQIAADFGVHPMTLTKWMRRAEVDEGTKPGTTTSDFAELRELRRRNRLLEQENDVLRRAAAYLSQANLPGNGSTRS
jgi:transposase